MPVVLPISDVPSDPHNIAAEDAREYLSDEERRVESAYALTLFSSWFYGWQALHAARNFIPPLSVSDGSQKPTVD
jgi:hypothetical protein